jgi:cell division protein FtsA
MYATCIGLIIRGYHDFEQGKLRFIGEGGNIIHLGGDDPIEVTAATAGVSQMVEAPALTDSLATEEDILSEATERAHNRGVRFGKLFDGLKNKFMGLFEEVEDREIE